MNTETHIAKWPAIKKGLQGKCPKCGDAKLFRAYLKQVEHCPSCGENWGEVRADDGPAWASMLVAGHVLAPFFYFITFRMDMPDWVRDICTCHCRSRDLLGRLAKNEGLVHCANLEHGRPDLQLL